MSVINFLKNLWWDEKINKTMNLILLIINIYITSLIYSIHIKDVLYKYSIDWITFNGVNILELLISFCFLVLIQNVLQFFILLICRIFRNGIIIDITRICNEQNLDIRTFFIGGNEERIKNMLTRIFFKFTVFVNDRSSIGNYIKEFVEDSNNFYVMNKGFVILISVLFSICYHFYYMDIFIITTAIIIILLILINTTCLLMIEYKPIVNEFFIQDKTPKNESNTTP